MNRLLPGDSARWLCKECQSKDNTWISVVTMLASSHYQEAPFPNHTAQNSVIMWQQTRQQWSSCCI